MTLAEIAAAAIACFLALVELTAYLMDAAGFAISPVAVLLVSLLITSFVTGTIVSNVRVEPPGRTIVPNDAVWLAAVLVVFGLVLRFGWPSLLPPGKGPDLTHHLLLIDYIERNWHLAHDVRLDAAMGEMAHYTPGSHLLAVLFGSWTGTDGFRAVYPLMAACAALTTGFVFLITLRASDRRAPLDGVPIALASVALVLLPRAYFLDAFAHDSYVAQVISALFAVALWWAIVVWDERPSVPIAVLIAIFAAGTFLAWPVWIGPPLLAFFLALVLHGDLPPATRARHATIALVPLLVVVTIHAIGQLGYALIVRTSGAVLNPSIDAVGWVFTIISLAGIAWSVRDRRARITGLLVVAIALQAATLYVIAKSNGASTPYMAFKMGYLAIYPLAAFGGLAMTGSTGSTGSTGATGSIVRWFIAVVLLIVAVRPLVDAPKPVPVVSRDFYEAGRWVRANVGSSCVDYLVEDPNTAYWLHLAVLGNPRATARTAEVDEHNLRNELAKWMPADGHPYAIADLTLLPDEIKSRVEVVKTFGRAAVIRRPGRTCEP